MRASWTRFTALARADRRARLTMLVAGYLAIELALWLLYAWGSFRTPAFIYQAF